MKRFSYLLVCAVLLVFLAAPVAFGQALNGQWFQLKVSQKGYAFGPGGIYKFSGSITNYMLLTWDDGNLVYNYSLFQPDGTQIPQGVNPFFAPIGDNEEIAADVGMEFARDDINYIVSWHTTRITIKRDSQGAFKSATFNSLGCEIIDGEVDGNTAFGGCVIKGKTIDPSKLPFTP
jgi:hypothetical protein